MRIVQSSTRLLFVLIALVGLLMGQRRDTGQPAGDRLLVVVPMVGKGTPDDPRRPLFVPTPQENAALETAKHAGKRPGESVSRILSWRIEQSDDGKFALLEITGTDQGAFAEIKASKRADVKVFEVGKATKDEIVNEFKKYKAAFDGSKFEGGARP